MFLPEWAETDPLGRSIFREVAASVGTSSTVVAGGEPVESALAFEGFESVEGLRALLHGTKLAIEPAQGAAAARFIAILIVCYVLGVRRFRG